MRITHVVHKILQLSILRLSQAAPNPPPERPRIPMPRQRAPRPSLDLEATLQTPMRVMLGTKCRCSLWAMDVYMAQLQSSLGSLLDSCSCCEHSNHLFQHPASSIQHLASGIGWHLCINLQPLYLHHGETFTFVFLSLTQIDRKSLEEQWTTS